MLTEPQKYFLEKAIELSKKGMQKGQGGPFGCIIAKGEDIIAEGYNLVTFSNDPTAHAEIIAIREACHKLQTYQLFDCELFTSCEPCPMCLGAIYWARLKMVVYANTRKQAAAIGFDDDLIYKEINGTIKDRKIPFFHYPLASAEKIFNEWKNWEGKRGY